MKKYQIIYADPPWPYSNKRKTVGGGLPYNDLSIQQIALLPISKIADRNCALFIWVTNPHLQNVFTIIKEWGFDYKAVAFDWIKYWKKKGISSIESKKGMSYYTKTNNELCLLAMRGKIKPISHSISGVICSPREEHSKKPDETRDRIIQLVGDIPRIELFARQKTPGWDVWGNEVESDISLYC